MKKVIILMLLVGAFALRAGADTLWINIEDFYFEPSIIYIPTGTTVTWYNMGPTAHTVTANDSSFYSGILAVGQSYSFTFNNVGDWGYHCSLHPMMMGSVYVTTPDNRAATLTLNPTNPPITIPAEGGSFQFYAQGFNNSNNVLNTQFWTKIYMPTTIISDTLSYQQDVSVDPMSTRQSTFMQNIAGSAPAGLYHFFAYGGTAEDSVIAFASFTFTKAGSVAGSIGSWETIQTVPWHYVDRNGNPIREAVKLKLSLRNYPQPFNPSTTISYTLPQDGVVKLEVFSISGARIATLVNRAEIAGDHSVEFSPNDLPSGMYLYRLQFGGQTLTNKMMFVK